MNGYHDPYHPEKGSNGQYITRDFVGNIIERTEREYPYSFSTHCTWLCSDTVKKKAAKMSDSSTIYSDRLYEANSTLFNQACRDVWKNEGQYFDKRRPQDIEKFLQRYYDNSSIVLTQIYKSCNTYNGYPCWCFLFAFNK